MPGPGRNDVSFNWQTNPTDPNMPTLKQKDPRMMTSQIIEKNNKILEKSTPAPNAYSATAWKSVKTGRYEKGGEKLCTFGNYTQKEDRITFVKSSEWKA